jgi:putative tricarboxylic transport membrane protein
MLENLLAGLSLTFDWLSLLLMGIGMFAGIIVGALPGLGPMQLIPISIPFTFWMQPYTALMFLLSEYVGSIYGGSISAILLNTPGTPAAVATGLDGHPLAKQGKIGKALKIALYSSIFGDIFSTCVLIVGAVILAEIAIKFGPPEMAAVILFSLALTATVLGKSAIKGLIAAVAGLIIGVVGSDPITGTPRMMFNLYELSQGVGLVPFIMGLFAVSEVFVQLGKKLSVQTIKGHLPHSDKKEDQRVSLREFLSVKKSVLLGTIVGTFFGTVPGIGASASAFAAYSAAQRMSRNPEKFGSGCLEGIASVEAANNATTASALIPFLTLGIPGCATVAVLAAAFMLHGVTPGPLIFIENGDVVYGIFVGLLFVNIIMLFEAQIGMKIFFKIVTGVPTAIIFPFVFVLCVAGTYATSNSILDVILMLFFGLMGYIMQKYEYPTAPFIISFILSPILERTMRQALVISHGSPIVFFTHPISLVFIILTVISISFVTVFMRK